MFESKIKEVLKASIGVKLLVLNDPHIILNVNRAATICIEAFRNKNKVLFCGNGGSAADAQHLAAEFSGRFYKDRPPLPSEALHVNTSYLTAVGNDYGFDQVYSRLIKGSGATGDILFGLSTSGNSINIIKAFEAAKALGMTCVALTGETGGNIAALADILINVPSKDTPRMQECHITLGHIICEIVETALFP